MSREFRQDRRYYRQRCRNDWRYSRHHRRDRSFFGIIIAIVGVILLLKVIGILSFITFTLTWPYILIAIGLLLGLKTGFRHAGSWILILIGIAYSVRPFPIFGHSSSELAWPAALIFIGLFIALRPRRKHPYMQPGMSNIDTVTSAENTIDIDVTFGGRKEFITSKDFKGGIVSATFGGCEVNFMQADSTERTIELTLKVSFGGVELIVPSHWEIQNDINTSFSSVEDERTIQTATPAEERKLLVLKGSCSFGSIEIKSY